MSILDFLLGRPLKTTEEKKEKLGPAAGIPVFGLDALSSASYGPEAALTLFIPLGAAGIVYILPVTFAIIVLLSIVYFSYRQTIEAYPGGGGSYTVARHNLGAFAGLLAAAALMIDYTLTVAVGISAGVGALVSAAPSLNGYTLPLCLAILVAISLVNLRGVRAAGLFFLAPTYLFVGCMFSMLGIGVIKTLMTGGHPASVVAPPLLRPATAAVSVWLLLKAFSSGCTAMTGVEAVSNGVRAFQKPVVKRAQKTLAAIIMMLILMLAGIAFLTHAYHVGATLPGSGYQSVLSQLTGAVAGKGIFYYLTMASILLVLSLSANTAFSDFPRLCHIIAEDCFLPIPFASQGRRLVYSEGIAVLTVLSAFLLILFDGITDRLIPLFAVGAFLAFTLSQSGMVAHWIRTGGRKARRSLMVNGVGALATGATVVVVTISKFTEGAWVTTLLIPAIIMGMLAVKRHYQRVGRETAEPGELDFAGLRPPVVVAPIAGWDEIAKRAVQFALNLSPDVQAVHVDTGGGSKKLQSEWESLVEEPARKAGVPVPKLVTLKSPYRFVLNPILDFILNLERTYPDRQIAVIVPELVERHWYLHFLHNQRGQWLKALLLLKGSRRIVIIDVPWYLSE